MQSQNILGELIVKISHNVGATNALLNLVQKIAVLQKDIATLIEGYYETSEPLVDASFDLSVGEFTFTGKQVSNQFTSTHLKSVIETNYLFLFKKAANLLSTAIIEKELAIKDMTLSVNYRTQPLITNELVETAVLRRELAFLEEKQRQIIELPEGHFCNLKTLCSKENTFLLTITGEAVKFRSDHLKKAYLHNLHDFIGKAKDDVAQRLLDDLRNELNRRTPFIIQQAVA